MQYYKINTSTWRLRVGSPFETEAVLPEYLGEAVKTGDLSPLRINRDDPRRIRISLLPEDIVLGLGQNMRGMNKRGGIYDSWCYDEANHSPHKRSLYGAHNFFILDGGTPERRFGVFVDFPGKVSFDVGYTRNDTLEIVTAEADYDLYLIRGEELSAITASFRRMIGRPYLPPRWALGYQQSRWGYDSAAEVEALGRRFREEGIPCDAIYLDIEYMERYKDFSIHPERFPDFAAHVARMGAMGFRLVPIIDAGVKIEEGYDVYEEGVAAGYFCSAESGEDFVAAVWPGKCHFPDFLNPLARRWFGSKYRMLTEAGIEGFWNDMNEPAIFYTEEGMAEAMELAEASKGKNLGVNDFFALREKFAFDDPEEDFKRFYHRLPDGSRIRHDRVHNIYGFNMTRAAAEGLKEIDPGKRYLLFSRSSYVGMHRYSGLWTGDNSSWWEHILLNIQMMPALNMCGFLYAGADIGGHMHDANGDLVTRWTQFGVFTPLFRNHATRQAREQEPFAYDEETLKRVRRAIQFRYALLPWLYGELMRAALSEELLFKPLSFAYEDERSRRVDDQLLLGSLMIAPIYTENARGRFVHLPETMLFWKVGDYHEKEFELLSAGDHWIAVEMDQIPLFIRPQGVLVLASHADCEAEQDYAELEAVVYMSEDQLDYRLYWDDGIASSPKAARHGVLELEINRNKGTYSARLTAAAVCPVERIQLYIIDSQGFTTQLTVARS